MGYSKDSSNLKNTMTREIHCLTPETEDECRIARRTIHDTLDVVGGKWELSMTETR